jgi:MFS family permease
VLCLSLLVVVIDNTILNTALPTLARVLHAGTSSLQWIADAYTLCFAALLVPAGALGDRYGRRLSLVGGLTVFALGSAAAAFASSAGTLIAARVVMGLGAAFVMPATLSILNSVFPPRERPQAIAAWSAVAGVGIVIGPTLGRPAALALLVGQRLPDQRPARGGGAGRRAADRAGDRRAGPPPPRLRGYPGDRRRTVPPGGRHHRGPTRGWTGALTLAEAAGGLAGLGLFTWWELHIPDPLIDLRVFAVRAFSAAAASVTVIFFALFGSLFVLTQYLQLVHGYSPLSAGLRALPFAIAMAAVSPVSTVLAGRLGSRVVIPAGIALMGAGLLDLSTAGVDTSYPPLAVAVAIMGAGMGLVMAPASTTIMTTVPGHQAGAGSAINDTIREVGGALGIAIIGSLAENVYRSKLGSTLAAAHVPQPVSHLATSSVAAADAVSRHLGGVTGGQLAAAAHSAFTTAMGTGMRVAAVVALLAAIGAAFALPGRGRPGTAAVPQPDGEAGRKDSIPGAGPAQVPAAAGPSTGRAGAGPELAATTVRLTPAR